MGIAHGRPCTERESDQFDDTEVVYILIGSPVVAVCRLIPLQQKSMLKTLWPELLPLSLPDETSIWELSRFAVDPDISKSKKCLYSTKLLWEAFVFAKKNHIQQYAVVTTPIFERFLKTMEVFLTRWNTKREGEMVIISGATEISSALEARLQINLERMALETA